MRFRLFLFSAMMFLLTPAVAVSQGIMGGWHASGESVTFNVALSGQRAVTGAAYSGTSNMENMLAGAMAECEGTIPR